MIFNTIMDNKQFLDLYIKIKNYINNNKNIIVCGPEYSGKTYLLNELYDLLKKNNYTVFYSVEHYMLSNKLNGITLSPKKFWIEETDKCKYKLHDILDDYEYIQTIHPSQNYIPFQDNHINM